jgi:hypothetical protein
VVDYTRTLLARHKQGYIFPVLLWVREQPASEGPPAFVGIMRALNTQEQHILMRDDFTITAASQASLVALGVDAAALSTGEYKIHDWIAEWDAMVDDLKETGSKGVNLCVDAANAQTRARERMFQHSLATMQGAAGARRRGGAAAAAAEAQALAALSAASAVTAGSSASEAHGGTHGGRTKRRTGGVERGGATASIMMALSTAGNGGPLWIKACLQELVVGGSCKVLILYWTRMSTDAYTVERATQLRRASLSSMGLDAAAIEAITAGHAADSNRSGASSAASSSAGSGRPAVAAAVMSTAHPAARAPTPIGGAGGGEAGRGRTGGTTKRPGTGGRSPAPAALPAGHPPVPAGAGVRGCPAMIKTDVFSDAPGAGGMVPAAAAPARGGGGGGNVAYGSVHTLTTAGHTDTETSADSGTGTPMLVSNRSSTVNPLAAASGATIPASPIAASDVAALVATEVHGSGSAVSDLPLPAPAPAPAGGRRPSTAGRTRPGSSSSRRALVLASPNSSAEDKPLLSAHHRRGSGGGGSGSMRDVTAAAAAAATGSDRLAIVAGRSQDSGRVPTDMLVVGGAAGGNTPPIAVDTGASAAQTTSSDHAGGDIPVSSPTVPGAVRDSSGLTTSVDGVAAGLAPMMAAGTGSSADDGDALIPGMHASPTVEAIGVMRTGSAFVESSGDGRAILVSSGGGEEGARGAPVVTATGPRVHAPSRRFSNSGPAPTPAPGASDPRRGSGVGGRAFLQDAGVAGAAGTGLVPATDSTSPHATAAVAGHTDNPAPGSLAGEVAVGGAVDPRSRRGSAAAGSYGGDPGQRGDRSSAGGSSKKSGTRQLQERIRRALEETTSALLPGLWRLSVGMVIVISITAALSVFLVTYMTSRFDQYRSTISAVGAARDIMLDSSVSAQLIGAMVNLPLSAATRTNYQSRLMGLASSIQNNHLALYATAQSVSLGSVYEDLSVTVRNFDVAGGGGLVEVPTLVSLQQAGLMMKAAIEAVASTTATSQAALAGDRSVLFVINNGYTGLPVHAAFNRTIVRWAQESKAKNADVQLVRSAASGVEGGSLGRPRALLPPPPAPPPLPFRCAGGDGHLRGHRAGDRGAGPGRHAPHPGAGACMHACVRACLRAWPPCDVRCLATAGAIVCVCACVRVAVRRWTARATISSCPSSACRWWCPPS